MRLRAAWQAARVLALAGLLGACASTPLQPLLAFPDREPFEQALLAYAQGQTDSAAQTLQQTDGATAGDARAQDLLAAVRAESEHRRLPPLGELAADTGPAPTTPAAAARPASGARNSAPTGTTNSAPRPPPPPPPPPRPAAPSEPNTLVP